MPDHPTTLDKLWRDDPFAGVYNLDGLNDVILTADVDWAPDFATQAMIDLVGEHGHKITIFATQESEALRNAPDFVEVGVHPDLTMRHNQRPHDETFAWIKGLYPDAVGMRSHCDFFGRNVADMAAAHGLTYDVSTLEFNVPLLQGHIDHNGMARFSYFWEDGHHLDMGYPLTWDDVKLDTPGMKVMNVHPILLYLNCETDKTRRDVVRNYKDLTQVPQSEIDPHVRTERGVRDLWVELLADLREHEVRTHLLGDLVRDAVPDPV